MHATRIVSVAITLIAALLLGACATAPRFETAGIAPGLTPREAAAQGAEVIGTRVLWGGVIVSSTNLPENTRLEVLAYPLDSSYQPRLEAAPNGRFLVLAPGYLETVDYAPGRLVTVSGRIIDLVSGRVGEAPYRFPQLVPDQLHLWRNDGRVSAPQFHIGVGVLFGD